MEVPGSLFRVRSSFLALKSLSNHQIYVMLPVGIIVEVMQTFDYLSRPGMVVMKVNGETLFTWACDLQQCTDAVAPQLRVLNGHLV